MLSVRGLTVHYGAVQALHGIDMDVAPGEVVSLIGSNGAGKSTTLRAISGLVRPSGGTITLDGRSLVGLPPHEIVALGVSHAPEGRGVFHPLTVDENLRLGAWGRRDPAGVARDRDRVFALFPRLAERIGQISGTLSGGEQQMLAIGRALLARPRVLLLDEPSLGLAPQVTATIFGILREVNASGTTLLLVEQNAAQALRIAHRATVIEVGRVALTGTAAELLASDEVRRAYLGVG
jgi:branched-chain amino acid transport system ATP-binding protein